MAALLKSFAFALPALWLVAGPANAADGQVAAKAFEQVCLANASSAAAARSGAERAGFAKGQTLPQLTPRGGAFETYTRAPLELVIREAKSGSFGCLVLFPPDVEVSNAAVAQAITALPGMTLRSSNGNDKTWRAKWVPAGAPKNSEVILTIYHESGKRTAILSLESKAKK